MKTEIIMEPKSQKRDADQSHYLSGNLVRKKSQDSGDWSKEIKLSMPEAQEALEST